ncbi:hypothetical protein [Caldalkalibacillus salinus]|uniref:hypothetical protein n=1 Tax=Caldalkalibacillus salinus TaxID=2803787 RepID=UPI0019220BED|nr:hypothetical protein [Caldalkalibacillus salinus]
MLTPLLFVSATIITVTGVLYYFKRMMADVNSHVQHSGGTFNEEYMHIVQKRFLLRFATVVSIPIILIISGFVRIEDTLRFHKVDVTIPLIIVIFTLSTGILGVVIERRKITPHLANAEHEKALITSLTLMGIGLVSMIPMISVVALLSMSG